MVIVTLLQLQLPQGYWLIQQAQLFLIDKKRRSKLNYKARSQKIFQWKEIPHMELISSPTESAKNMFLDYLYETYPTYLLKYIE